MTTTLNSVECSAEEFVWWLRRNRLRLPDLLGMSPCTQIETDVDELVRWAQEDADGAVRVANDPDARAEMFFPAGWSARLREAALLLARLLAEPRWSCFAGRSEGERETFAGGVAGRADAVVIADDGQRVKMTPLRSPEVAASVARAILPSGIVASNFSPVRITPSMAKAAAGDSAKLLKSAHVDARDAEWFTTVDAKVTAGGFLGASAYTPQGHRPGPLAAQWRESPVGGYLTLGAKGEEHMLEPLSVSSMTRALVEAVASAQ